MESFNVNQNESFTDEELGLGNIASAKPSVDLDGFSEASSSDLGARQQFEINMNKPKDDDVRSNFSAQSEQSVSSYISYAGG